MFRRILAVTAILAVSSTAAFVAPSAQASNVRWNVSIGLPGVGIAVGAPRYVGGYIAPRPVYAAPRAYYGPPAYPAYYPAPAYYSAPVVVPRHVYRTDYRPVYGPVRYPAYRPAYPAYNR